MAEEPRTEPCGSCSWRQTSPCKVLGWALVELLCGVMEIPDLNSQMEHCQSIGSSEKSPPSVSSDTHTHTHPYMMDTDKISHVYTGKVTWKHIHT